MDRTQRLGWAFGELKNKVDDNFHGNITFNVADGVIGGATINESRKPDVDNKVKKP